MVYFVISSVLLILENLKPKSLGGRNKNVTNGSVLLIEILGKLRNKLNY